MDIGHRILCFLSIVAIALLITKCISIRSSSMNSLFSKRDLNSHENCLVTGNKSKYSACIQDPLLNNGFIISVSRIEDVGTIQQSLNSNDKRFVVQFNDNKYIVKNNINEREQITPICGHKELKYIMGEKQTQMIYSI
tara:strand:- start:1074 stop:1487 length:414 start_codon:yes stop_codon:yes gene_type:complete